MIKFNPNYFFRLGNLFYFNSHYVRSWLISISALIFLVTVEACVKSHAWDYYTLPKERRDAEGLSEAPHYTAKCENHAWAWYKLAIWGFYTGTWFLMAGVAAYFYPKSKLIPILTLAYIVLPLLVKMRYRFDSKSDEHIDWWLKFILRKSEGQSPPAILSNIPVFIGKKPMVNPISDEEYAIIVTGKNLEGTTLNIAEKDKGKLSIVSSQPTVDTESLSFSARIKVLKECREGTYNIEVKNRSNQNYKSPQIHIRVAPQAPTIFTGLTYGEDGEGTPPTVSTAAQTVFVTILGSNLNGAEMEAPTNFSLTDVNNSQPDKLTVKVTIQAGTPAKDDYVFHISNTNPQKASFNFPVKPA